VSVLLWCLALLATARPGFGQPPASVTLTTDSPHLALSATNDGDDEVRWLSVFVTIENQTDSELRIPPTAWQLRDSRETHTPVRILDALTTSEVADGDKQVPLATLQPLEVTVAPKTQRRVGLFFQPLSIDLRRPELSLKLTINDLQLATVDLDQTASDRLQITVQRIGPAGAVALLHLSGELNSLNAGRLVQQIDELADDSRVLRFVIELDETLRVPDPGVMAWLRLVARQTGLGEIYNERFPQLSSEILTVHLTESPAPDDEPSRRDRLLAEHYDNVHPTLAAAVEAAVIPLCERLPRELLLAELRHGKPVSVGVVLRHCGERLTDDDVPLILKFLQSDHASLRLAALETLRHFETPAAIAALNTAAQSQDETTALAALSAMATSRYGLVREQLLTLLETTDSTLRQRATRTLARHPQSEWAPRLIELAGDTDTEIRRAALVGLIALGHPQLNGLLRAGLNDDDDSIRQLSLRQLMASREPEDERLAIEAVLQQLETSPPSRGTTLFLERVRDPRVAPLVRRWLKSETPRIRRRAVQILLATGDPQVLDELAADFKSLGPTEQAAILAALHDTSSPDFWKLAPQGLRSGRGRLLEVTIELLQRDGSRRAVTLLADALSDETLATSRRALAICQTLASIATPAARDALIGHAKDGPATLNSAAATALQQLYARSPAMPFMIRGSALLDPANGRYNPTLAMLHFNLAVETDPDHPPSRVARADIALKATKPSQQELEAARDDLRVAIRFDPSSTNALTCLGLTEVRLGDIDAGIQLVEDSRDRFNDDALYHYNTACVYGRAIEALEAQLKSQSPPSEKLRTTIKRYRAQAVADLRQSIENGLDEFNQNWMREDPDLATVRQSPDFQQLFEKTVTLPAIPNELK